MYHIPVEMRFGFLGVHASKYRAGAISTLRFCRLESVWAGEDLFLSEFSSEFTDDASLDP
jgi:hypothetical protein